MAETLPTPAPPETIPSSPAPSPVAESVRAACLADKARAHEAACATVRGGVRDAVTGVREAYVDGMCERVRERFVGIDGLDGFITMIKGLDPAAQKRIFEVFNTSGEGVLSMIEDTIAKSGVFPTQGVIISFLDSAQERIVKAATSTLTATKNITRVRAERATGDREIQEHSAQIDAPIIRERSRLLTEVFERFRSEHGDAFADMERTAIADLGLTGRTITDDDRVAIYTHIFQSRESRVRILTLAREYDTTNGTKTADFYADRFRQLDHILGGIGDIDRDIAAVRTPAATEGFRPMATIRGTDTLVSVGPDIVSLIVPDPDHPELAERVLSSRDGRYQTTVPEIYPIDTYEARLSTVRGDMLTIRDHMASIDTFLDEHTQDIDPAVRDDYLAARTKLQQHMDTLTEIATTLQRTIYAVSHDDRLRPDTVVTRREHERERVAAYERWGVTRLGQRIADTLMDTIGDVTRERTGVDLRLHDGITVSSEAVVRGALTSLLGNETFQWEPFAVQDFAGGQAVDQDYLLQRLTDKGILRADGVIDDLRLRAALLSGRGTREPVAA